MGEGNRKAGFPCWRSWEALEDEGEDVTWKETWVGRLWSFVRWKLSPGGQASLQNPRSSSGQGQGGGEESPRKHET